MINAILTRIVGTKNERELKRIRPVVAQIGAFEPALRALDDHALAAKTVEFRERLARGATLDDLLPEAFAVVREGGRRVLNMRHFDVQLIGGMVLHRGMIAEMKTGEGKTLVATLAAYLNALTGKGVHVVTVNDYLAKRDSEWMGRVYRFLGLTVGVIQHSMDDRERQEAYGADITYGTNNEFGFDYLRDNMKFDLGMYVQRGHNFAIVDEVDSILIDEARTPLIISGPAEESTDKYYRIDQIIPKLKPGARITGDKKAEERAELEKTGDYIVDEKNKTVTLTEMGMAHCERLLGVKNLWDPSNMDVLHHVNQGLRAHCLFHRDVDYVVKDGEVMIVDEFTGRLMPGRRWSDGLHQAVEAKEKVKIERENQTLATITFQNYFRMYEKLSGMTGTAETEAPEFDKIYKLEVLVIPTNRPLIRVENPDVVYRTEPEKFGAVVKEIEDLHESGRPVLVGTISIEKSETLSTLLKKAGIKHVVLNAKYHEREAEMVAQAGRFGAVMIATNMAGRGTDIILGGVPDHRAKAVLVDRLVEKKLDPGHTTPEDQQAAWDQVAGEMAGEFKRELQQRKPTPQMRSELGPPLPRAHGLVRPRPPVGAFGPRPRPRGLAARRLPRRRSRPAPRHQGENRQVLLPGDREPGRLPRRPPPEGLDRGPGRDARVRQRRAAARRERARAGGGAGGCPHPGHRAARGPPHRQPAARPRRPPGRPRLLALLPVAPGRPDAHLRLGAHQRPHAPPGHGGGRPHRARDGDEVDRARAEAGGGAELLHPQAPARVRRRDEQAAPLRLRHAAHGARGQGHPRAPDAAGGRGGGVVRRELLLREGQPLQLEHRGPAGRAQGDLRARDALAGAARPRTRRDGAEARRAASADATRSASASSAPSGCSSTSA